MVRTSVRHAVVATALALACGGMLAACGDDDDSDGGATTSTTATAAKQLAITAAEDADGERATLTLPSRFAAGVVKITVTNEGRKPHSIQLVRVDGDRTAKDVLDVVGADSEDSKIPTWLHAAGGVAGVDPGASSTATQKLEPGKYFVFDDEEEGKDREVKALTVTGEAVDGELPKAPATITASEYKFTTSGIKAGDNTVLFENVGKELHHVLAFPMREGATIAKVVKFFRTEKGRAPISGKPLGTIVLDGGFSQVVEMTFKPDTSYALVCFIPDRNGGPPHAFKGMVNRLDVT